MQLINGENIVDIPYMIFKLTKPNKNVFKFKKKCDYVYIGITSVYISRVDRTLIEDENWRLRFTKFISNLYTKIQQFSHIIYNIKDEIRLVFSVRAISLHVNILKQQLISSRMSILKTFKAFYPQMEFKSITNLDVLKLIDTSYICAGIVKILPSDDDNKEELLRIIQQQNSSIIFDNYERISNESMNVIIDSINNLISKYKSGAIQTETFSTSTPLMASTLLGTSLGITKSIGNNRAQTRSESNTNGHTISVGKRSGISIKDWDRSNLVEIKQTEHNIQNMRSFESFSNYEISKLSLSELERMKNQGTISTAAYLRLYASIEAQAHAGIDTMYGGGGIEARAGIEGGLDTRAENIHQVSSDSITEKMNEAGQRNEAGINNENIRGSSVEVTEHRYAGKFYSENNSIINSQSSNKTNSEGVSETVGLTWGQTKSDRKTISFSGTSGVVESNTIMRQVVQEGHLHIIDILLARRFEYEIGLGLGGYMNTGIILSKDKLQLTDAISGLISAYTFDRQYIKPIFISTIYDKELVSILRQYVLFQKVFAVKNWEHPIGGIEGYFTSIPVFAHQITSKIRPPLQEIPGIIVEEENIPEYPQYKTKGNIKLGRSLYLGSLTNNRILFDNRKNVHIGIFGKTGFGKTVSCLQMISQLMEQGNKLFILDPKGCGDYLYLYDIAENSDNLLYFTFKRSTEGHRPITPFKLDLLRPIPGFAFIEWLKIFLDSLVGAYGLRDRSRMVLQDLVLNYKKINKISPTLSELKLLIEDYLEHAKIDRDYETRDNLNRILLRIKNFIDFYGDFFDILPNTGVKLEDIFDNYSVILELGDLTDQDDLTFISIFLSNILFNYRKRFPLKSKKQYIVLEEICSIIPKDNDYTGTALVRKILSRIVRESRIFGLRLIFLNQLVAEFRKEIPEILSNIDCYILHRLDPRDDRQILGGLFGWQDSSIKSYKVENLRHILRLKVGEVIYRSKEIDAPMHVKIIPDFSLFLEPDFQYAINISKKYLEEQNLVCQETDVPSNQNDQNNTNNEHTKFNMKIEKEKIFKILSALIKGNESLNKIIKNTELNNEEIMEALDYLTNNNYVRQYEKKYIPTPNGISLFNLLKNLEK